MRLSGHYKTGAMLQPRFVLVSSQLNNRRASNPGHRTAPNFMSDPFAVAREAQSPLLSPHLEAPNHTVGATERHLNTNDVVWIAWPTSPLLSTRVMPALRADHATGLREICTSTHPLKEMFTSTSPALHQYTLCSCGKQRGT